MALNAQFYFAWVDQGEPFNPAVHNRVDERIISFRGEHMEGDFGVLNLVIKNPLVSLLDPSRKVWAYLSWDKGAGVEALFYGRLVAVPNDINKEAVTLVLIARPFDYMIRKTILAESLKKPPSWEPIFLGGKEADEDIDKVWEARTSLWHIDRVTHEVTDSDLLNGDSLEDFSEREVPYDSVEIQIQQAPVRGVTIDATFSWMQSSRGKFYVFRDSEFRTFGADKLAENWPKSGADLDGGWRVAFGTAKHELDRYPDDAFQTRIQVDPPPKPLDSNVEVVEPVPPPPVSKIGQEIPEGWVLAITNITGEVTKDGTSSSAQGMVVPISRCWGTLQLEYAAARPRVERIRFTLMADVQNLVTAPEEQEVTFIELQGGDVGLVMDDYGGVAIGDPQRPSFLPTDRGAQTIEYLLMYARSHLALKSRAIHVTWQCKFERAVQLSCRKNARLHDRRLPGGSAVGKIIGYSFEMMAGKLIGSVTVGCCIGKGGAIAEVAGDPSYVKEGYVKKGYQRYDGGIKVVGPSVVGYTPPANYPNDDGLRFPLLRPPFISPPAISLITNIETGFPSALDIEAWRYLFQSGQVQTWDQVARQAEAVLKNIKPSIELRLMSVTGGPFETVYNLSVTDLKIPAMINLG